MATKYLANTHTFHSLEEDAYYWIFLFQGNHDIEKKYYAIGFLSTFIPWLLFIEWRWFKEFEKIVGN